MGFSTKIDKRVHESRAGQEFEYSIVKCTGGRDTFWGLSDLLQKLAHVKHETCPR